MSSSYSHLGSRFDSVIEEDTDGVVETLMHDLCSGLEFFNVDFQQVDFEGLLEGFDDFCRHPDHGRDDVHFGGSKRYSTVSMELENLMDDTSCIDRFVSGGSDLDADSTALGINMSSNVFFGFDHDGENVFVPFDPESLVVDNDVGLGSEEVNDAVMQFMDMGQQLAGDGNDDSASIGGGEVVDDMACQVTGEWEVMSPEQGAAFARSFDHVDTSYSLAMLEQFLEIESALLGLPPASTNVVNNLPEVTISEADLENGNVVVCAVCNEEMNVGGKAKQLPCGHRYHGGCILPWLAISNTCPVCRHELPTDNAVYEARRALRARQTM